MFLQLLGLGGIGRDEERRGGLLKKRIGT